MTKRIYTLLAIVLFAASGFAQTDKIIGRWKTIDDNDGTTKSIVHIFKATNGKFYGKVEKLYKEPERKCTECVGSNKNKPILGMTVVAGMLEKEGNLTGGTILDPANGKVYRCNISYDSKEDVLHVRGSLDKMGLIGRTQTWLREK